MKKYKKKRYLVFHNDSLSPDYIKLKNAEIDALNKADKNVNEFNNILHHTKRQFINIKNTKDAKPKHITRTQPMEEIPSLERFPSVDTTNRLDSNADYYNNSKKPEMKKAVTKLTRKKRPSPREDMPSR
jgi:hypothetical protein